MAEELKTTAISKLPEAISVAEGDCILVVQNRKAKKARPSLFRGPKGDIGPTGATGANPVLKFTSRGIEVKLSNQADSAYTLLVPIASITGPRGLQGLTGATGANIVPRAGETGIEYKLSTEPDSAYRLLVPYSQITGPQGEPGKDFQILGYFDTLDLLKAGITTPNPGDAYGVGTAAPYPIYIWDAINQLWRDNGAIQGPAGRSGKSARVNTTSGYWEEFDDDTQAWKQTEAVAVYPVATAERDGLMSKDDKAKLDQMKGGDVEVSKANVEKVLTGNIISHTHETERIVTGMPTDVWDGVTVSTALAGSGTVDDPYLIQSCADYIHFYRNPSLYSHDIGMESGPTPEQAANLKQMKFTSHLDFNNHHLDFGSTVLNPNQESGPQSIAKALVLINIDGQGCNLSNINFLNTWAVIPFSLYCAIKNIHVTNGIFTIPLSFIHEKELFITSNQILLSPWGIVLGYSEVEDISFVAEIKFTGDIATSIMFVPGAIVITGSAGEIPGISVGEKPYFYSNVTYTCDDILTNLVTIQHASAYINKGDTSIIVTGYDCTKAYKDPPFEPTQGLAVAMFIAGASDGPYTMYINSDNALPWDGNDSFHISKTTAEMKSPEFLALLNGDTETFVADTENINDGYPIFKPNQTVQTYDGYVKESVFEAFKTSVPTIPTNTTMSDGYYVNKIAGNIFETQKSLSEAITELGISATDKSINIVNLDIDVSGIISGLTADLQTAFFGKTYTAPTNDNIVQLLGGNEGIRSLVKKLMPKNNPIITVPMMLYFCPSQLVSVAAGCIVDGTTIESIDQLDGLLISITAQFVACVDKTELYTFNISINKFNTAEQTASYSWSSQTIGGDVKSDDIGQVKFLTQSEYDSLYSKDYKTLYLIKNE